MPDQGAVHDVGEERDDEAEQRGVRHHQPQPLQRTAQAGAPGRRSWPSIVAPTAPPSPRNTTQ